MATGNSEADGYLAELREYAGRGHGCSRAAAAWAVRTIEPMIDSVRAWEAGEEDEDEDDGT